MALVPQAQTFEQLKDVDEELLIKSRLTTVEVKTINRVQKRCTTICTTENLLTDALSSPPPKDDTNVEMADASAGPTIGSPIPASLSERVEGATERLTEETLLDFAPLEEALMRIQLLTAANRKEVARYEQKKMQIEQASQKARTEMVELNTNLAEAHQFKQYKLEYDVIATEITASPSSQKTRQAQNDSIARLNAEIDALEREKAEYAKVWAARRAQFGAIVEALMGMQAQIQEDKEEQERREGLDDDEEDGEKADTAGAVKTEGDATTQDAAGKGAAGLGAEPAGKEGGDVVMEDSQMEEGERVSTRHASAVTSPRFEEGEEIEEGEEREDTARDVSVAPTPGPHDGPFEEMDTDGQPPDRDDDMDEDGAIEEDDVQEPKSHRS